MAQIFDEILARGIRQGQIPARSQEARNWFREKARQARSAAAYPKNIIDDSDKRKPRLGPGRMLTFFYDPKTKADLPYYDRFPLIFFVQPAKGGFHGINLHYLPPRLRASLMDNLYDIASDRKYNENTRIELSYKILNGASKYKYFKPTFKHYLFNQVQSRVVEISAAEWDIALFLPTERFEKASKSKVWTDSRKMVT